jgi:nicotinamidase-related amidase
MFALLPEAVLINIKMIEKKNKEQEILNIKSRKSAFYSTPLISLVKNSKT